MIKLVSNILIICSILTSSISGAQNSKDDPNLQAAFQAQGALKLEASKQLFQKVVANSEANKKDRSEALRQLAIIDWKFYKDYNKAKIKLQLADSIGHYRSETWINVLRVEAESNRFSNAIDAGRKAIALSESEADKTYYKYKYCKVILDEAIIQINEEKLVDEKKLSEAALILSQVLSTNPTNVNAADILLGISLLQKDGVTAMQAWLSYYRFSDVENAYDYLKPAALELNKILLNWNTSSLSTNEKIGLIEALAKSRFYKYVNVLAKVFNFRTLSTDKTAKDIIAYADYIEEIMVFTNEYYRSVSLIKSKSEDFISGLSAKNEQLYKQLLVSETKIDSFSTDNFRDLIRSKFGNYYLIGGTSASREVGLVSGHIVNERIRNIEQYGHSADFTFIELDMMVSNNYPSWFWENRGAGGYALTGGFLRIKTMFKYLAINAWDKVSDKVKRSKIVKDIETNLLSSNLDTDIKVIRSALASKLELDALDTLYNKLKIEGLKGIELQLKFIEQYELYRDNATMFAHEGRHCIDRVVLQEDYRALGTATIEFRGRLSQIAFSTAPKLEVSNMVNGIGSSPTGQSIQMISDVLENWIILNTEKIKGYDSTKQPLSQLYKLTDNQIITCIKNVDPFYIESIKKKN